PVGEHRAHFVVAEPEASTHQVVDLADQLHVAVLNAVVHHLDEVAGAAIADPFAAGLAFGRARADRLEYRLDARPRRGTATRHQRRAVERAFLAAGDTGTNVAATRGLGGVEAPDRVGVEAVAAVDHDVAGLEQRQQLRQELIDRGT